MMSQFSKLIFSGLERPVCNERKRRLLGKIFKTSDKYLTLRLRGHPETLRNVTFRMIIVSFHDGKYKQIDSPFCFMTI